MMIDILMCIPAWISILSTFIIVCAFFMGHQIGIFSPSVIYLSSLQLSSIHPSDLKCSFPRLTHSLTLFLFFYTLCTSLFPVASSPPRLSHHSSAPRQPCEDDITYQSSTSDISARWTIPEMLQPFVTNVLWTVEQEVEIYLGALCQISKFR